MLAMVNLSKLVRNGRLLGRELEQPPDSSNASNAVWPWVTPPQHKSAVGTGTFLAYYNLGALYHLFGEAVAARQCFERAAGLGYEPACLRDADDAGILSGLCFRGTGY